MLEFGKVVEEAGFPPGVVNIISGHGDPFTALSISASSKTINGDFPPNSKETSAKFSAEFLITCLAVAGPPVKLIL